MSAPKPQLLLVDDDTATIHILSELLADLTDQRFAQTGEEALMVARETVPDLILLDANLPGMTGFDVCEKLKADPALAHVPVIFVTSHSSPALRGDAFKLGAADYVTKPIVASELRARVFALLKATELFTKLTQRNDLQPASAHLRHPGLTKILVIDSMGDPMQTFAPVLSDTCILQIARTAQNGLEIALNARPHVIFVDADVAGIDGLYLCAKIKATEALAEIPIVFIAQQRTLETEQRARLFGATMVLAKPIAAPKLLACVEMLLSPLSKGRPDSAH